MIDGLDAQAQRFLIDLEFVTRRVAQAQARISSGKRMLAPSDGPEDVARLVQSRSALTWTVELRRSLERVQGEVNAGEQALATAVQVLDRITVLGAQGASDTSEADQRAILAGEVGALVVQLVNIAATEVEGRRIFSGDADGVVPYTIDLSQANPYSAYLGAASTREALHPAGTRLSIALTAEQIFDDPDPAKNVFQAANNLRLALQNNDGDSIRQAVAGLRTAAAHLNSQLANYGVIQNQVVEAITASHHQELSLKGQISSVEDADLTEEILKMTQGQTTQEAALHTQAQIRRRSLFDYIG